MKKLTLMSVVAVLCLQMNAQQPPGIHKVFGVQPVMPLNIGDHVPEALWNMPLQGVNHPDHEDTITLDEYRGKLIILDFWATWCSSCIAQFAEEDSLQKVYKDELQILLVSSKKSRDNKETIQKFFNKNAKNEKTYSLPSVIEDTMLSGLFPHRFIPHYVWINSRGIVGAITNAEAVTAFNISALLKDGNTNLPLKQDVMDYNSKRPLLQDGNGGSTDKLLFSSTLTGYLEGMGRGAHVNENGVTKRVTFINYPILALYQTALGFDVNRVVPFIKDSLRLFKKEQTNSEWRNHLYCYEYSIPVRETQDNAAIDMVNDLNNHFKLYGRMETREMECYVLIKAAREKDIMEIRKVQPNIKLHNQPISMLLRDLNAQLITAPGPIFLDETGYSEKVSMELYSNVNNLRSLKKELQTYGFDLVPAKREIQVFVLSELKSNN